MKIYTLTLNPAFDIHASAKDLTLYHENLAHISSRDAGGKGVNISRALSLNGVNNKPIVVLGEENAADFERALKEDGMVALTVTRPGRIRENLTLHEENKPETRISFAGFAADSSILTDTEALMDIDENTVVTLTGSLPKGVDMIAVKQFCARLKSKGAKLIIDSRSFTLDDLIEVKPWLIKPNGEEIEIYAKAEITALSDCLPFAKHLISLGIEHVMVTLGEQGALLATKNEALTACPPALTAISTVGAGDSTIAGFLCATAQNMPLSDCLRLAVSYGSAACLTDGTNPPQSEDIARIAPQVQICAID